MQFEVEQKHRLTDLNEFFSQLSERGVELAEPVEQVDQYFAHPARDFARTDEALRIRTIKSQSFVTYKGPKLDTTTKTRHELELPLHPQDADGGLFRQLLLALGFTPVATVRKQRRVFQMVHLGHKVHGSIDQVDQLGTFVELEMSADESNLEETKQVVATLATELNLDHSERRSYLEMLLEQHSAGEN